MIDRIPVKDSSPFSFRISTKDKKLFQRLYPYCMSRFIKRCINRACKDKNFFNEVYFNTSEE